MEMDKVTLRSAALLAETLPSSARAEEEIEVSLSQLQELQSRLAEQSPVNFADSLTELKGLCSAITAFNQCYEDLQDHLESIKTAILSKLSAETDNVSTLPHSIGELPNSAEGEDKNHLSEIKKLCKTMCSRDVKKYLIGNLSNIDNLREEVPKALKLAPNPSKLVLECLGRFFLQGSKAYTKNSPMIPAREASVLILECFLLMMGMYDDDDGALTIDKGVKEEAENVAVAWRKRLLSEGGVAKASEIDARGLLLFLSCFGILNKFKRDDIRDLVVAGNVKEILGVLRNSRELMNKVTEMVEWFMKNNKELSAVDLVYTFGLVERFNPQTILISFLRESKETGKIIKKAAMGSAAAMLQANKKQLAPLRSIVECLERYEIDPSKLLPGWQIRQKISNLEKEIAKFDRKQGDKGNKRKSSEDTSRMLKIQEVKRARFTGHGPQHNAQDHVDALPSHVYNYSATPSVVYGGPSAGVIPENVLPPADISANHTGVLSTGSYTGVHGQIINHGTQSHSWHVDAALIEKYSSQPTSLGLTSLYRASTSAQGFAGNPNNGPGTRSTASDLYQFADSVVESGSYLGSISRSLGPGTNTVPASTLTPAYRPSYLY